MTHDRTRAIVEAAEAVFRVDFQTDAWYFQEEAEALKDALALPAPSEPPQSAADWLLLCAEDALAITPTCLADEELRDELRDAVDRYKKGWPSPTAPEWTRTPPSEPGMFWTRRQLENGRGVLVRIAQVFPDIGMVDFACGETSVPFAELANDDWFPVRIEEPPA